MADEERRQEPQEDWVPYKDYKAPTQSTLWQVIDVLFVLILCYICLLIPILLSDAIIVG